MGVVVLFCPRSGKTPKDTAFPLLSSLSTFLVLVPHWPFTGYVELQLAKVYVIITVC